MPFTKDVTTLKRKGLHLVTTVSIVALMLSATTSSVCAQSGSGEAQRTEDTSANRMWFEGYLQGSEVDTPQGSPPYALSVDGNAIGIATHLGQFTFTYKANVKLPQGSSTGNAELIAGGDSLFTAFVGQGETTNPDTPTLNSIVEISSITGGTGRFSGAVGTFIVKRLADVATGFTSGSVHGTILLSPAASPGIH